MGNVGAGPAARQALLLDQSLNSSLVAPQVASGAAHELVSVFPDQDPNMTLSQIFRQLFSSKTKLMTKLMVLVKVALPPGNNSNLHPTGR